MLSTGRPAPFRKMIVWDGVAGGRITLDAHDVGSAFMGYVMENELMHHIMLEHLREPDSDQVHLIDSHQLQQIVPYDENDAVHPWIRLLFATPSSSSSAASSTSSSSSSASKAQPSEFTCRLVIGADGVDSAVSRLAGLESIGFDYRQSALVATLHGCQLTLPDDDDPVAWQRFLPTGPIALLPV
jgi:ubiquinone biosynthesis monooxygenase Coq6